MQIKSPGVIYFQSLLKVSGFLDHVVSLSNLAFSLRFQFCDWTKRSNVMNAGRHFVGGSLIGGIEETQEMLDFCGEHNITCMIEKVPITYINTAMARLEKSDVHYRFVIDIVNSLKEDANGVWMKVVLCKTCTWRFGPENNSACDLCS